MTIIQKGGKMSDLIDKDMAIAAIRKALNGLPMAVMTLPPAQPEILTCGEGELVQTGSSDLISRQVAIDAIQRIGRLATLPDNDAVIRMSAVEYVLYNLPSAQSELTEKEWQQVKKLRSFHNGTYAKVLDKLMVCASAQPEIIRCRDCVNHVDRNFCRKANHYTGDGEYCASVFGAERGTNETD